MLKHTYAKINTLLARPDMRANPLRAVCRRIVWRCHWRTRPEKPLITRFHQQMTIQLPRTGSAALLYYQGYSEPPLARLFGALLTPAATCMDLGAHTGEYTLLAAHAVGPQGKVHSFEAQPDLCQLVQQNVQRNQLHHRTHVNCAAICDQPDQQLAFRVPAERSGASIRPRQAHAHSPAEAVIHVPATTLDHYISQHLAPDQHVHLIKMDIEGAEPLALRGAATLLGRPPQHAPIWLMEYSPANCARLGLDATESLGILRQHGYHLHRVHDDGRTSPLPETEQHALQTCNLLASKRPLTLP